MIHIARVTERSSVELTQFDRSFIVDSELRVHLEAGKLNYEIVPVEPYEKTYPSLERSSEFAESMVTFSAHASHHPVGRIDLSRNWNGFAYVHDLVVAKTSRRSGVGSALLNQAIEWSRTERLGGVMVETQSNNVPACRLYARCGFTLGGFDSALYRAAGLAKREVALFWYWHSSEHVSQ